MPEFETIRHGQKNAEGGLSEEGKEKSRIKAQEIYEQIKNTPGGSIVYCIPSSVGRAIETRDEIESELRILCESEKDIEFISVQDAARLSEVKGDFTKKLIVTELQPTSSIGFDAKTDYLPAWKDYGKRLGGSDYNILTVWASKPEEMESLREEMGTKFQDIDTSTLKPQDFVRTPEEEALNYLRLSKRLGEITKQHFPGHPFRNIQVGHNPADFAVLALMDKEITLKNLHELWDGKSRDFLESALFQEVDGKIIVKYRQHAVEKEVSLIEVIKRLERQSEERKAGWRISK